MRVIQIIIIMCLSVFSLNAQKTSTLTPNELDEQFTPKGTGPLSAESKASKSSSSRSGSYGDYPKSLVKFSPTLLARSIIAVYYERNFADYFSVVGGLGFNYNKDVIFSMIGAASFLNDKGLQGEVSSETVFASSTHDSPSLYFNIAPKFVFDNYWNDGHSYLQMDFSHYANKMMYAIEPNTSSYQGFSGSPLIKYSHNLYSLKWGYQFITDSKLITSHEFFVSLGYRSIKYTPVIATMAVNPQPFSSSNYQIQSVAPTTVVGQSIYLGIGYTFGIGFNK